MYGVTTDARGDIFAVDWSNNRVLKVDRSASALSFANTVVGSTSSDSPKTATVTNLGNESLVISQNPTYPTEFSEDSGGSNLCAASTSLYPGEECALSANFIPGSVGSRSGNIVVTDNSLNASSTTQSVAVSGTGVGPGDATAAAVSVSPASDNRSRLRRR
jgi:hypothetical protein